jgi:hypothetical protein
LPKAGIDYSIESLAFRKPLKTSSANAAGRFRFRGYADYMQTDRFREALQRLIELLKEKTVYCCSEAVFCVPSPTCADALVVCGYTVGNIFNRRKSTA